MKASVRASTPYGDKTCGVARKVQAVCPRTSTQRASRRQGWRKSLRLTNVLPNCPLRSWPKAPTQPRLFPFSSSSCQELASARQDSRPAAGMTPRAKATPVRICGLSRAQGTVVPFRVSLRCCVLACFSSAIRLSPRRAFPPPFAPAYSLFLWRFLWVFRSVASSEYVCGCVCIYESRLSFCESFVFRTVALYFVGCRASPASPCLYSTVVGAAPARTLQSVPPSSKQDRLV